MLAASVRRSSLVLQSSSRLSYLEIWNFARQRRLGRAQQVLHSLEKRRGYHASRKFFQQIRDSESITVPLEQYKSAGKRHSRANLGNAVETY